MTVRESELAMRRRLGASEHNMLITQGNLAATYEELGRYEEALEIKREVYIGRLKLSGKENYDTIRDSNNYAVALTSQLRCEEARSLLRKTMPVARRVLGENDETTLRARWIYAKTLWLDDGATLDHLREAVTTLEDTKRTARRVLGGAHPTTEGIEEDLEMSRAALRARETPSTSA